LKEGIEMKKNSIRRLVSLSFIFLSLPLYSQTIKFSATLVSKNYTNYNRKIDSIRIQNEKYHIDTLIINSTSIDLSKITIVNTSNDDVDFTVLNYPGSENNSFKIRLRSDNNVSIIISDLLGKIISQKTLYLNSGENIVSVDERDLSSGFYMITFISENKIISKKLLTAGGFHISSDLTNINKTENHLEIQSGNIYNFIGYSQYCFPDTISGVTPKDSDEYKFVFKFDTTSFPVKSMNFEINLPNSLYHTYGYFRSNPPPNLDKIDTITYNFSFSIDITSAHIYSTGNIFNIETHTDKNETIINTECKFVIDSLNNKIINFYYYDDRCHTPVNGGDQTSRIDITSQFNELNYTDNSDSYIIYVYNNELAKLLSTTGNSFSYQMIWAGSGSATGGQELKRTLSYNENSYLKITLRK
jgi:hypothetical protein